MSDSSDDEPLAVKRQKLNHVNGKAVPNKEVSKPSATVKEEDSSDDEPIAQKKRPAKKQKLASSTKSPKDPSTPRGGKAEKKRKAKEDSQEEGSAKKPVIKRERKVYDNPGQTKETPDETDPIRKFYSSLHEQRPESAMARKWLLIHGLLAIEEAEMYLEELAKIKTPVKKKPLTKASPATKREVKKPQKKKDRDCAFDDGGLDEDSEDDKPLALRAS